MFLTSFYCVLRRNLRCSGVLQCFHQTRHLTVFLHFFNRKTGYLRCFFTVLCRILRYNATEVVYGVFLTVLYSLGDVLNQNTIKQSKNDLFDGVTIPKQR